MTTAIFLVGTNPLPNLVAFKYLTGDQSLIESVFEREQLTQAVLVYSRRPEGMKAIAERLKSQMEAVCPVELLEISDARQPDRIYADIQRYLHDRHPKERIHLHYTGGTKTMAVHSHRAVSSRSGLGNNRVTASYLDAERFVLQFDNGEAWPEAGIRDLRAESICEVDMPQLITLHGKVQSDEEAFATKYGNTTKLMLDCFAGVRVDARENLFRDYDQCRRSMAVFNNRIPNRNSRKRSEREAFGSLRASCIDWPRRFPGLPKALATDLSVDGLQGSSSLCFPQLSDDGMVQELVEFMHGKWLEHAVRMVVDQIRAGNKVTPRITDARASLIAHPPNARNRTMELDVVLMQGYQMTLISCTASKSIATCKEHTFEAIHRAVQVGGDGARAVLLCLMDKRDVDDLQKEMREEYGTQDALLEIWGWDELAMLEQKLTSLLNRR